MAENREERRNNSLPGSWDRLKRVGRKALAAVLCGALACMLLPQPLLSGKTGADGRTGGALVQAAEMEYVRIGLTSNYGGVGQITLQNTSLSYGYCIDSVFYPEAKLYSGTGVKVAADSGSYVVYQETYGSYAAALKDAALLKGLYSVAGVMPASCGKGKWRLYVPVKSAGTKLSGLTIGNTRSSSHMLRVTMEKGGFLVDAGLAGSYPQFSPDVEKGGTAVVKLSGGKAYRGRMEIGRYGNSGVTAVNVLPLEQYLYGVVSSEMSASWPIEALKAQAVCSRGFAVLTAGPGSSGTLEKGYKMTDTTLHQAYQGYHSEQPASTKAVEDTRGETVCYENQVVKTYYFSTSGGSTEAVEDVWVSNIPYLRSVSDIYENNPAKKPWLVSMTKSEIGSRLLAKGKSVGTVLDVKPEIITQTGRIYSLRVEGTNGAATLEKDQVRTVLGLYSTKFKIVKYGETPDLVSMKGNGASTSRRISGSYVINGDGRVKKADTSMEQYVVLSADNRTGFALEAPENGNSVIFAGTGYGHGVGMSQSGARGMAEAGFTYQEILQHYFTGTTVR